MTAFLETRSTSRRFFFRSTKATWLRNLSAGIAGAGGEVDAHEVVEHQRLRRLRELGAAVGQGVLGGIEDLAQLRPLTSVLPSSRASPNPCLPTWLPR